MIPYVQSHYDVSKQPAQRAFAGFSFGGYVTGTLLVEDAATFSSFGLFSPCPSALNVPTAAQAAAISRVGVMVGGGLQDQLCHQYAAQDVAILHNAHANDVTEFFYGGHDWNVWRRLLRDFLTRVAFKPAASSPSPNGRRLRCTVGGRIGVAGGRRTNDHNVTQPLDPGQGCDVWSM